MWPDAWGVRMEHILNILLALLEQPDPTMQDILRIVSDKTFRTAVPKSLKNATVRTFFQKEFDRYSFDYRADGVASIQNKLGAFLADPVLNRILTTSKTDIHVRKIMDEGKILLVNLAKGRLGEDSSSLLGGLLVTTNRAAFFFLPRCDAEEVRAAHDLRAQSFLLNGEAVNCLAEI